MKPEQFQDAITLLPEELLESVDALRRKKRFPWKSVLTTAACFCLVLGLAFGYAKLVAPASKESAAGDAYYSAEDAPESPELLNSTVSHSTSEFPSLVEVVQVEADHIFVVSAVSSDSDSCALRAPIKLTFEKLAQAPTLGVGQTILIYWYTEDYDPVEHSISPYQIEIAEE